jgi:hypothetical protein
VSVLRRDLRAVERLAEELDHGADGVAHDGGAGLLGLVAGGHPDGQDVRAVLAGTSTPAEPEQGTSRRPR